MQQADAVLAVAVADEEFAAVAAGRADVLVFFTFALVVVVVVGHGRDVRPATVVANDRRERALAVGTQRVDPRPLEQARQVEAVATRLGPARFLRQCVEADGAALFFFIFGIVWLVLLRCCWLAQRRQPVDAAWGLLSMSDITIAAKLAPGSS